MANKGGKCPLRRFFPELLTLQWINLLTVNCTQKYLHWIRSCERKPSVDQGRCMMQHSQGDYGHLLIIQIHRVLDVIYCNHYAFVRMWNNSNFLLTEMWEMLGDNLLSSIILQEQPDIPKMIPRFYTPARGDFSGIYKGWVFGGVRIGGRCSLRHKTSHVGWCYGLHWGTLKLQELWGQPWKNLWEVPELLFSGLNLFVQGWRSKKLPPTFSSPTKTFQNFQFS